MLATTLSLDARILVVDDNAADGRLMESALVGAGYRRVRVTNEPLAVCDLVSALGADVLVVDMLMPGYNGFGLMQRVRAIAGDDPPAMIAVTSDPAVMGEALESGACDFIAKPINPGEMLARIGNQARIQMSLRKLRSDRELLARELRESEETFWLFADNSPLGMFIRGVDDGRYKFVNAAFRRLTGRDIAPGDPIGDVLRILHPDDLALLAEHIERQPDAVMDQEMRFRHADGAERIGNVHTFPLRDSSGRTAWIGGVVEDVTARKAAENALREAEARYRTLVEQSIAGIYLLDRDFRFVYANPRMCEIMGVAPGTLEGQETLELVIAEDRDLVRANRATARSGDTFALRSTYRMRRADGVVVHLSIDAKEIELNGRGVLLAIAQDVTQRESAQAAIAEANERLAALSKRVLAVQEEERRRISRELHDDVGQSLVALRIALHNLRQRVEAKDVELVAHCASVADTIQERVRELSVELVPPQLGELGLADALRWLARRQKTLTGLAIVCRIGTIARFPVPVEVACYRICQEALSNATRHAGAAHIAIELDSDEDAVILTVRDNGRGFDALAMRGQALAAGSLGLISMEERARLAGGSLTMQTGPAQGTIVVARFPVTAAHDERQAAGDRS